MTHQIHTTAINSFFPCYSVQMAHTKRTSVNYITDYICIKGNVPMTMSHLKVRTGISDSSKKPRIMLDQHDDNCDLFFLKHKSFVKLDTMPKDMCFVDIKENTDVDITDVDITDVDITDVGITDVGINDKCDMSKVESAMLVWTKVKSIHAETTIHGSSEYKSIGMYSDEHEQTDVHAALDCLAYLNDDGMINIASMNRDTFAFTAKTQISYEDEIKVLTSSGLLIDETAVLICDYPISRQLFESVSFKERLANSLSKYGMNSSTDLFFLSTCINSMSIHTSNVASGIIEQQTQYDDKYLFQDGILNNIIVVLDGLISNRCKKANLTSNLQTA